MTIITLWIIYILSALVTVYYWWRIVDVIIKWQYQREPKIRRDMKNPVSLIIASRNDIENLKINLPKILSQRYDFLEIIIVDDDSDDGSAEWLQAMSTQDHRIKIISHTKTREGKKDALSIGIASAQYPHLLFTDADCSPQSEEWITIMQAHLPSHDVVLGYGPFNKEKGLLNSFCRYDASLIALQYMSRAMKGNAYMAVGRNMMYKKDIYNQVNGFANHQDVVSGDDDLFIQSLSPSISFSVELDADSFVYSDAPKTWQSFIEQKSRHITTSRYYPTQDQLWLAIFPVALFIYYLLTVYMVTYNWLLVASLLIFRWVALILLFKRIFATLRQTDLLKFIPLLDLMYLPAYFVIFWNSKLAVKKPWSR